MLNADSSDPWKDDAAFRGLANKRELTLHRLSWHCANFLCGECDGKIHYKFKKFKTQWIDFKTGETITEFEDVEWDTHHDSVQTEGGGNQTEQNTPEGTPCECLFCHGRPGYDEWKKKQTQPAQTIGRMQVVPDKARELTEEEKEKLK